MVRSFCPVAVFLDPVFVGGDCWIVSSIHNYMWWWPLHFMLPQSTHSLVFVFWWVFMICSLRCCSLNSLSDLSNLSIGFLSVHLRIASISSLNPWFCQLPSVLTKSALQGRHQVDFFWGEGYVILGPFILDNIRTLLKVLQK